MKIRINNYIDNYLEYLERVKYDLSLNKEEVWNDCCYKVNSDMYEHIFDLYHQINSDVSLALGPINSFGINSLEEKLRAAQKRIENSICRVVEYMSEFDNKDIEVSLNIVVGNMSTNAIVTGYDGLSLFVFAERLPDEKYIDILIAHELSHIIHSYSYSETISVPKLSDLVFCEGIAISISQAICPGYEMLEYINFSAEGNLGHRKTLITSRINKIVNDIDSDSIEVIRNYMTNGESITQSRIGYDIGYYIVQYLSKNISLEEQLTLSSKEVREVFRDYAEKALKCIR